MAYNWAKYKMFGEQEQVCFIEGRDEYDPAVAAEDERYLKEGKTVGWWYQNEYCNGKLVGRILVVYNYRQNPVTWHGRILETREDISVYLSKHEKKAIYSKMEAFNIENTQTSPWYENH